MLSQLAWLTQEFKAGLTLEKLVQFSLQIKQKSLHDYFYKWIQIFNFYSLFQFLAIKNEIMLFVGTWNGVHCVKWNNPVSQKQDSCVFFSQCNIYVGEDEK